MQIIPLTADYDQQMSIIANDQNITIRLRYNSAIERWNLDLAQDDLPILVGQRMPLNANALAGFDFGLGALMLYAEDDTVEPNYENVISGIVQLVHIEPAEL